MLFSLANLILGHFFFSPSYTLPLLFLGCNPVKLFFFSFQKPNIVGSNPVVLDRGQFCLPRDIWHCLEVFLIVTIKWYYSSEKKPGKGKPPTTNDLAPNVSSAEAE